jgi:hypothetical protein
MAMSLHVMQSKKLGTSMGQKIVMDAFCNAY